MKYKVVTLGGGTGMSSLLKGLKKFPFDISSIVSVCDDGKSTGRLREEFGIPAVGDVRKVLVALSEVEPLVEELFDYRFSNGNGLSGHTTGNLLLTAATNICGNMSDGIEALSKILNLNGKVIPLTEENVHLIAKTKDGLIIEGEHNITQAKKVIKSVYYKENPKVNEKALNAIKEADLIILSMGSLYTSVIPNLLIKELITEIDKSKAPIMYSCNMMTQPGETDNFKVSNHIKLLNKYLGKKKISVVIANNKIIDKEIKNRYESLEQKDQVLLDKNNLKNIEIIEEDFFIIENNLIRHDSIKLGLSIFSYMLEKERNHN
ncbi:MAG: YvcK family protein [Tenericutes bacterium]|nr:uridine diphosphate-N-acetylglucosamine-binding protein YvcK [Bacilli bacterium]NLV90482.1 YvcK family protein [Mycoplasmatota bacterium]